MNELEFIDTCRHIFELNGFDCSVDQAKKLFLLTQIMLRTNKTMNLTAIKDEKSIILKHYVDSVTISKYIPEGSDILDVGCGAGFPTLPLAIFRPDISITALDSTEKRIRYVNSTAKELDLQKVTAIAARAEEKANESTYRESFSIVSARAVAALPVLCELCIPFVKPGGTMIAMKSRQADEEIANSMRCIELCSAAFDKDISLELSSENGEKDERRLIFIKKIGKTPKIYPRHFSKISKKPL